MTGGSLIKWAYDQYVGVALSVMSRYPYGTNVYEYDWDSLILLDTCRVDALQEVSDEFEFLPPADEISSITSIGSGSYTWMANTFTEEFADEVANTVYVSANAYAEEILEVGWKPEEDRGVSYCNWSTLRADDLMAVDQSWKYCNHIMGHPDPEMVTKRAIGHYRQYEPDRLIVHYTQPHEPYIAQALEEGREELFDYEEKPWDYLKGGGDLDKVWACYLDDLRMVLRHVETLLNNHDADNVIISADHGDAFGEYGIYRHPTAILHPKIRNVPWAKTSAVDKKEVEGSTDSAPQNTNVTETLENLGYL